MFQTQIWQTTDIPHHCTPNRHSLTNGEKQFCGWTEVTEVILVESASPLLWISCQTLNSQSLKTNNQEGVKLFCHHSPPSLIFPFFSSFSVSPHPSVKLMCRQKQCKAISKQIAVISQSMMHNHPFSTLQAWWQPGSLIGLWWGKRLKAPRQLTDGEWRCS